MNHVEGGPPFRMTVGLRQIALHDLTGAVFHQRMTHEAEHGAGVGRLFVEPGIRVGGRGMRGIGPLLAPEVDFDIAVLAAGTGHRSGLGNGRFGVVFGGSVGSGWATGIIVGRRVGALGLEALH